MITEDQLEQLCLSWFEETGYDVVCGYDIAPGEANAERSDYRQVTLQGRLLQQLQLINPDIPVATLEQVALQVAMPETPVLMINNKLFHQQLLQGIKVEYKDKIGEAITDYVQLVDFSNVSNNHFLVVNQFTITGSKGSSDVRRRPDVIVFINGLPLAVLELKNPADQNADIWQAYQQLQTYKLSLIHI